MLYSWNDFSNGKYSQISFAQNLSQDMSKIYPFINQTINLPDSEELGKKAINIRACTAKSIVNSNCQ